MLNGLEEQVNQALSRFDIETQPGKWLYFWKSKKINKDSKVAKKVLYPHITSHVLMVEPTQFFLNEETFKDNKFMERVKDSKSKSTQEAIQEFKKMAENL